MPICATRNCVNLMMRYGRSKSLAMPRINSHRILSDVSNNLRRKESRKRINKREDDLIRSPKQ